MNIMSMVEGEKDRHQLAGGENPTALESAPVTKRRGGWRAACGCTLPAVAYFRIALGLLLTLELLLRFRFVRPFYSDQGTLPRKFLTGLHQDVWYRLVCVHGQVGSVGGQGLLLILQVAAAVALTLGWHPRAMAALSWWLYISLSLRNPWLNYILDRYFHYLLFMAIFLPLDEHGTLSLTPNPKATLPKSKHHFQVTPATIALKLLVVWIYLDAGGGKLLDPQRGWSYQADPLSALDTYARHTWTARLLYALWGPAGWRLLTPLVVQIELGAAPLALWGSWRGSWHWTYTAVGLIVSLHLGIALCIRNAALLSWVACTPWILFLPLGLSHHTEPATPYDPRSPEPATPLAPTRPSSRRDPDQVLAAVCLTSLALGCVWMETLSEPCHQSTDHLWSTLLHNRWNVFVGAEEYVTWEIAPGQLEDGTIVDVWSRKEGVDWSLPGSGAPGTATSRPGRWRSFPYLAELDTEAADALWGYLCQEWNDSQGVVAPGKKLVRFNFFMLQADVLPNLTFGPTRKRLIRSYECSRKAPALLETTDDGSKPAETLAAAVETLVQSEL